ncbi:MAG: molybdenum cofactor biosynthesis protein MoaE [Gemmatimonadota bacterium]
MGNRIRAEPLSLDELLRDTGGTESGALVVFAGTVRGAEEGREVVALEYDVHPAMAERVLAAIEEEIAGRDGIAACRIVHRVGAVPAGEPSVYVVVRGRHRPEAFEAAREGIDRVKREAPIWKTILHPDGSRTAGRESVPLGLGILPRTPAPSAASARNRG